MWVDVIASLRTELEPAAVRAVVRDLSTYPHWLEIVTDVQPDATTGADRAWTVELRGQIGPLRRAKRLRMERTVDTDDRVRFERAEVDGREHSPWTLSAEVVPTSSGSNLTMRLHYGGGLWLPLLDRLLRDEIERSKLRLVAQVAGRD